MRAGRQGQQSESRTHVDALGDHGDHAAGLEAGRKLLFSLADVGRLEDAAEVSAANGNAVLVGRALWVAA